MSGKKRQNTQLSHNNYTSLEIVTIHFLSGVWGKSLRKKGPLEKKSSEKSSLEKTSSEKRSAKKGPLEKKFLDKVLGKKVSGKKSLKKRSLLKECEENLSREFGIF